MSFTKEDFIALVTDEGKEDEFTECFGRTMEDYFEEFPETVYLTWIDHLDDLDIDIPDELWEMKEKGEAEAKAAKREEKLKKARELTKTSARVILMYSKNIDKVMIFTNRKNRILKARGSKAGLLKMGKDISITKALELTDYKNFEDVVEQELELNIDYEVVFDADVESTQHLNDILREWAESGKKPSGGNWWDTGRRDWTMIDRDLEDA